MHCYRCKLAIEPGQVIRKFNKPVPGTVYHATCPTGARPESQSAAPAVPIILEVPSEPTVAQVDEDRIREIAQDVISEKVDAVTAAVADAVKANAMTMEQAQAMVDAAIDKRAVRITVTPLDAPEYKIENAHANMAWAVALAEQGENLYLYGPPGSGKSTAAEMFADARGLRFEYVSLSEMSMPSLIFGAPTVHGEVTRTAFRDCVEFGGVMAIDELDNSHPNFITSLNAGIAGPWVAFPDVKVRKHKDFYLWASGNTDMRGTDPAYPERRAKGAATLDRFAYVPWPIDGDLERRVALGWNPQAGPWITWVQAVRAWAATNDRKLVLSPRATFAIAKALKTGALSREQMLHSSAFKGIDDIRVRAILAAVPLPA